VVTLDKTDSIAPFVYLALPARIKAKGNSAKRKIVLVDVNKKKVKKHLELGDDVGYNGVTGKGIVKTVLRGFFQEFSMAKTIE
jgi:hypothetical protein